MRIYCIRNLVNGKIYIGSAEKLNRRKSIHLYLLKVNKHHCLHLQRAWNKYGKDNFVFEVIEYVSNKNDLLKREQVWIDFFKPEYNTARIVGRSMTGRKHSGQTIQKMKINRGGKKFPVNQLDDSGVVLKEYSCVVEAANQLKVSSTSIYIAIKTNYRCCGFYWNYKHIKYDPESIKDGMKEQLRLRRERRRLKNSKQC